MRAHSVVTDAMIVTDIWFPPGSALPTHTHDRTIFGVMLDGAFESAIAGRTLECGIETAWTEPLGEPHANTIGTCGARVLAIQPDLGREELFEGLRPLLTDIHLVQTAGICAEAGRLVGEMRSDDSFTALTVDALSMLLLTSAARLQFERKNHASPPAWLLQARDMLHDQFASPPNILELSRTAGVSSSHLAHSFTRHFHITPGEYVRRVRVHWVSERLSMSDRPLSELALAAGYCDQAHLTREVRRVLGKTPGALRRRRKAAMEEGA